MQVSALAPTALPAEAAAACFHCGSPLPASGVRFVTVEARARPVCCAGCQAVTEIILAGGLDEYYRRREQRAKTPASTQEDWSVYDLPAVQASFVRDAGGTLREASLMLEGIRCAACVWLNEQHLARLPGVRSVQINYASERALVRWDADQVALSAILRAVEQIGYRALPYDAQRREQALRSERRVALRRLFVAALGMMQVMMYAVPVYLADGDMTADIEQLMRWASLLLTMPVVLYSAQPFFAGATRELRSTRLGMDVPVALGIGAAFLASFWATVAGRGEVYFDSVTMFVFLLLGGRYLEREARQRAAASIESALPQVPTFSMRLHAAADWSRAERVPTAGLVEGDWVLVKPGERIPADGTIGQGNTEVDESLLSGESRPLTRGHGQRVLAGTTNVVSPFALRVERVGAHTALAAIARLVERAAAEKPPLAQAADRIASWFVAALLVLALAGALAWLAIEPGRALPTVVALLVVSCPCALSLATPAALAAATGTLARAGLVPVRGHALEAMARVTHVVFDKTGTLTEGKLSLSAVRPLTDASAPRVIAFAQALQAGSEHPIARAILAEPVQEACLAQDLRSVTGSGVEGLIDGERYRLGKAEFVAELCGALPRLRDDETPQTIVWLASSGGCLGYLVLADHVREDASQVVANLKAAGKDVLLLSGDAPGPVERLASQLGIERYHAHMSPQQKFDYVRELQREGAVVMMVGDGVNDAPVLAAADVSVAMSNATELAQSSADVVLTSQRLVALSQGAALAQRTRRVMRQNLGWAFAYNAIAIPAAAFGWVTPWLAALGMSLSSLVVVANALRLLPRRRPWSG